MNYLEMINAVESAENTIKLADRATDKLVKLLAGRLKKVTSYRGMEALAEMKKELKDFDSRKQQWKD